jgi:hypothetical protein
MPPPTVVPVTIQTLEGAVDDASYNLLYARVPSEYKVLVDGIYFIKFDPYRTKRSKNTAWYTRPRHCLELVQASKSLDSKLDHTLAHYASIVTLPQCKWKYFQRV